MKITKVTKKKCMNCGSRAEELSPIGCEKCMPKKVLTKHRRLVELGGYIVPNVVTK